MPNTTGFNPVIQGEGKLVVQAFLSPVIKAGSAIGAIGELTLMNNTGALSYTLPLATAPGQACGLKSRITDASLQAITILTQGGQPMFAGILDQPSTSMAFVGNVGESAVFVSGYNQNNVLCWFLVDYQTGSTYNGA